MLWGLKVGGVQRGETKKRVLLIGKLFFFLLFFHCSFPLYFQDDFQSLSYFKYFLIASGIGNLNIWKY